MTGQVTQQEATQETIRAIRAAAPAPAFLLMGPSAVGIWTRWLEEQVRGAKTSLTSEATRTKETPDKTRTVAKASAPALLSLISLARGPRTRWREEQVKAAKTSLTREAPRTGENPERPKTVVEAFAPARQYVITVAGGPRTRWREVQIRGAKTDKCSREGPSSSAPVSVTGRGPMDPMAGRASQKG